jgi:hypothetical protein
MSESPSTPSIRRRRAIDEDISFEEGEEHVHICVRVRPFNARELELQRQQDDRTLRSVVEMPKGMAGEVVCLEKTGKEYRVVEEFHVTKSFWSITEEQQPHPFAPVSQKDVYESVGLPIIKYAFAGFNNCVFAYGQTGSGKTYTMMGDFESVNGVLGGNPGIIPRLCYDLFHHIQLKKNEKEQGIIKSIEVKLSAIEIYNEQVRDLFWRFSPGRTKQQVLKIRKSPVDGSFFVDQLTIVAPKDWTECIRFIEKGVAERTVAATDMNDESSRSHCLFQLILEQTETVHIESDDPEERFLKPVTSRKASKINLVDLAGSERLKKSGAQGQQLKEAAGINLSLTTLKKVIDALVTNSKEANPKKHVLIPFRESALTMLLSDSLGGNSKTTMIACVSPHFDNQEETLLTLRYANRTGSIVNNARVNEDSAAKQALRLKHQILELQKRLAEGPVDEEAEDLQDQLEVGRQALRSMEEASKRQEQIAAEMLRRSAKEQETLLSSAFYSTLKMTMLQQQREQIEKSAVALESRIQQNQEESQRLLSQVEEAMAKEAELSKIIEKMRRESITHREQEMEQDHQTKKIVREHREVMHKLEKEVELRYAQRILNAWRLKKLRQKVDADIERTQKEMDDKLNEVIMQAAEQYELQVRQFADAETIVQQKTAQLSREIGALVQHRDAEEKRCQVLMSEIRNEERRHSEAVKRIDAEWQAKYDTMKEHHERRISELDETYYRQLRQWDERVDDETYIVSFDQQQTVNVLENKLREVEGEWNAKVTDAVQREANIIDERMKEALREHALNAARKRREYEGRIGELYVKLERARSMVHEHDQSIEYLEKVLGPLRKHYDAVCAPPPRMSSPEYESLRQMMLRFGGAVSTVKPVPPQLLIRSAQKQPPPEFSSPRSHAKTSASTIICPAQSTPTRASPIDERNTPTVFDVPTPKSSDQRHREMRLPFGQVTSPPSFTVTRTPAGTKSPGIRRDPRLASTPPKALFGSPKSPSSLGHSSNRVMRGNNS